MERSESKRQSLTLLARYRRRSLAWRTAIGPRRTQRAFEAIDCVPIDLTIGHCAGDYLRQYAKSHPVELGDALIAATASVHKLDLWTRNRRHYPMKDIAFY
jgi:predicted nucleic acid-binding protein